MMERQACLNFAAGESSFSFSPPITTTTNVSSPSFSSTTSSSSTFGTAPSATNTQLPTFGTTTTNTSTPSPFSSTTSSSSPFGTVTSATNTLLPTFGTTTTGTSNSTKGFGFGSTSFSTNAPTTVPSTTSTPSTLGFGSTVGTCFGTTQHNSNVFPFPSGSNPFCGEYITLTGPNNADLVKRCKELCDLDIKIFTNDKLVTTIACNRLLLTNLSEKLDDLLKIKSNKDGDKFVFTVSTEEFEPIIGKIDVLVLVHLFECIVKGTVRLHINQSFHLLVLLDHLDLISTMRLLRNFLCQSFAQQYALLFVTKFNNFYKEGHVCNIDLMSLFLTALNNVINGIDNITNQIEFGKIHQCLLERFLNSTSKTASLRCIFQSIDIWLESNKSVGSDSVQVVTLLDSIQLQSPKDHTQIISTLSCYPSRFQFINTMDIVMRLKLIHKHALLIK